MKIHGLLITKNAAGKVANRILLIYKRLCLAIGTVFRYCLGLLRVSVVRCLHTFDYRGRKRHYKASSLSFYLV